MGAPSIEREHNLWVWHHHCVSVDWTTGQINIFEDGEQVENKIQKTLIDDYAVHWSKPINLVLVGCFNWLEGLGETTIGKFADVQVFFRVLSSDQIREITQCKTFLRQ